MFFIAGSLEIGSDMKENAPRFSGRWITHTKVSILNKSNHKNTHALDRGGISVVISIEKLGETQIVHNWLFISLGFDGVKKINIKSVLK